MPLLTGSEQLRLYRGQDYIVNDHITIHIPTLGEICDYGEDEYFNLVRQFTATPTDLCWRLWDAGIDFTAISDYQLFSQITSKMFSQDQSRILFGGLDFRKFKLRTYLKNDEVVMYSEDDDWFMDELTYEIMADCLRAIHFFDKNVQTPANESTKEILIEDAREESLRQRSGEHQSYLLNLISAMVNIEGFKYNHGDVWNMRINAFMDSVMRIGKIKNANLLLQSGYSGFGVNLKQIDNKQLNWMGDLR